MKEYKLVYGTLIETNAQKKKRLKLEKRGEISQQESNNKDTELSWVMENCGSNLKKLNLSTQNISSNTNQSLNVKKISHFESDEVQTTKLSITNHELSTTVENVNNNHDNIARTDSSHSNHDIESSSIYNNESLSGSDISDIKNAATKSSYFKNLSDVIIKNLPSFPIMGSKPESSTQSTEILSISAIDDPETIKFPSVTRILSQTMPLESKLALEAWKERMIKELGQEGFEKHQKGI